MPHHKQNPEWDVISPAEFFHIRNKTLHEAVFKSAVIFLTSLNADGFNEC
jgi:hypothetical protein